ncbi:hypothetical protein N790_04580 [Arenimonas malthae CC-JY-1]|uniref:Pilus biosynthesis protein PilE n=1 Tax=Arenimonas malthae CC-JY-1 TaxID=1384054 RepID=A0A091BL96_9GAMM|nr:type IV pilin protein [Arenimonas malthae]KFN51579.1 hypothetical protein N790_04580 [Arenimonas malthae CC-JY-1]
MTQQQNKERGFTLIELMIAVAIIAVLAGISYPAYIDYTTNTRRSVATACLTEMAQFMERYYTTNMSYVDADVPDLACEQELAGFYVFAVVGEPTASAFSLSATPQNIQASRDTKCGTLGLNQIGAKTETGTGTVADCW